MTGLNRGRLGELYYSLGPVYQAYRAIDRHTPLRLHRWLYNKHKISTTGHDTRPPAVRRTVGRLHSLGRSLFERLSAFEVEVLGAKSY